MKDIQSCSISRDQSNVRKNDMIREHGALKSFVN